MVMALNTAEIQWLNDLNTFYWMNTNLAFCSACVETGFLWLYKMAVEGTPML